MTEILDRIEAWQSAGLIDATTADRLREAEARATSPGEATPTTAAGAPPGAGAVSAASSFFGPTPTIVEVFAYLGAGFFMGAWAAFLARIGGFDNRDVVVAVGSAVLVAILVAAGLVLRRGDDRRRRGAGVVLLIATSAAGIAATSFAQVVHVDYGPPTQILVFGSALAVAILGRFLMPAVTTQVAVLGSLTGLAAAIFSGIESLLGPAAPACCIATEPVAANPWLLVVMPAVGWLLLSLLIGLVGLRESRRPDEAAQRRASLTRFWAGLVAIAGVATAVLRESDLGNGEYGRVIEPWLGEAALVLLSVVLLERAFRRGSAAFLACAAIGLVTALTDFNFHYLSESTDIGLLIEGVILLAVGFGAERLRRRLERARAGAPRSLEPLGPATA